MGPADMYEKAVEFLHSAGRLRINPSLENITEFLKEAAIKKKFPIIQVSGTNGKTSTSVFLSSLLRSVPLKVGLFLSPHVYHYGERIAVNGRSLSKHDFGKLISDFMQKYHLLIEKYELTEFEILTAAALEYFGEKGIDIAVFETGLGGKFDAVSALNADFGILTGIGFDHMDLLGNTLEEIAYQKLYPFRGKDLYVYEGFLQDEIVNEAEILGVNLKVVELSSSRVEVSKDGTLLGDPYRIKLKLTGYSFASNAILSFESLKDKGFSVDIKALESVQVPARFQKVYSKDGLIILEGSHNPQAVQVFFENFRSIFSDEEYSVICGFMKDKDYETMMNIIKSNKPAAAFLVPIEGAGDRSARLYGYADGFFSYEISLETALKKALSYANIVVVIGSIYLCGDFIQKFGDSLGYGIFGYDEIGRFVYHG
jgi:dihydrofolate synthase/folylpolyglutamate synthase